MNAKSCLGSWLVKVRASEQERERARALKARFKAMLREGLALLVCHSDLKGHASIGRRSFGLYYLLNMLLELVGTQRIMHVGINLRERERDAVASSCMSVSIFRQVLQKPIGASHGGEHDMQSCQRTCFSLS